MGQKLEEPILRVLLGTVDREQTSPPTHPVLSFIQVSLHSFLFLESVPSPPVSPIGLSGFIRFCFAQRALDQDQSGYFCLLGSLHCTGPSALPTPSPLQGSAPPIPSPPS